jgi:hypothetical protein
MSAGRGEHYMRPAGPGGRRVLSGGVIPGDGLE